VFLSSGFKTEGAPPPYGTLKPTAIQPVFEILHLGKPNTMESDVYCHTQVSDVFTLGLFGSYSLGGLGLMPSHL
jgi:hypothetical protein